MSTTYGLVTTYARLLTVDEAADRLRVKRSTFYQLMRTGQIVTVKIGGARRVPPEAIDAYLARLVNEQNG